VSGPDRSVGQAILPSVCAVPRQSEKAEAATGSGCWDVTLCLPRSALPQAEGIALLSRPGQPRAREGARGRLSLSARSASAAAAASEAQLMEPEIHRCSCYRPCWLSVCVRVSAESRRALPGSFRCTYGRRRRNPRGQIVAVWNNFVLFRGLAWHVL